MLEVVVVGEDISRLREDRNDSKGCYCGNG